MTSDRSKCYIPNMRLLLLTIAMVSFALAESPAKADSIVADSAAPLAMVAVPDTIYDTVYVAFDDGIPWNREHFNPDRLLRHETFDPALSVAYTYSVSFFSSPWLKLSQQSYLAHLAYEFTPDLHLYADLGLWMPLYVHWNGPDAIAKEDVRQGNVQFILPDVELEYRPTDNVSMHLMVVNESDAFKAYGPWREPLRPYDRRRYSTFRRR